jgi:hypothetical protein
VVPSLRLPSCVGIVNTIPEAITTGSVGLGSCDVARMWVGQDAGWGVEQ